MATIDFLQAKRGDLLEIASHHGVTSIRVFGSVARGEDSPESDVDLLITTGPEVSSWFPAGLILDLERLLGRRIDVVTETGLNPRLRESVLSEAIPL